MGDIFDQAATQTAPPPQGDIFDQAATPQRSFSDRVGDRIGQNVNAPAHILNMLPDAVSSALRNDAATKGHSAQYQHMMQPWGDSALAKAAAAATVAPRMGYDLMKEYMDDPAKLIGDIVTVKALHGIDEPTETPAKAKPAETSGAPDASTWMPKALKVVSPKIGNMLEAVRDGRWGKLVPERIQALQDLVGTLQKGEAPPTAQAPGVPENWGQGRYGTPVDQWGQRIAQPAEQAPPQASSLSKVPVRTVRQAQALGPNAQVMKQSQPLAQAPAEPQWPAAYQNSPKTLTANDAGGANYSPADLAALKARMGIAQPAESPASQFPPRGPVAKVQFDPNRPLVTSKGQPEFDLHGILREIDGDNAIEDAMRSDLERHGTIARMQANREFAASMSMDTPKGVRFDQAKNLLAGGKVADVTVPVVGSPTEPMEFPNGLKVFKTGGQWFAKGGQWKGGSWVRITADDLKSALNPTALAPSQDLTGVLQQSVDAARKK